MEISTSWITQNEICEQKSSICNLLSVTDFSERIHITECENKPPKESYEKKTEKKYLER